MAGIYIHIPFCKQACHYCDFHFSTSLKKVDEMLSSFKIELLLRKNELKGQTVETIYFGGGTPSLLSVKELEWLISLIQIEYNVSKNPEITLETNPDDLTKEKIIKLSKSSINRLSIGIQSFFDDDLKTMNRAHSADEAKESLEIAGKYFDNITIDLIYGIPNMSVEKWKDNLFQAFSYGVPHISSYALTVEPKTALDSFIKRGIYPSLDDELTLKHFSLLIEETEKRGFVHYEVSNFGKPDYFSKHNTSYWRGELYIGIGPSAHSFNGNQRCWNISNNTKYIQSLKLFELPLTIEELSNNDRFNEYIMTGLRTIWGVSIDKIENDFGIEYKNHLLTSSKNFINQELLVISDMSDKTQNKDHVLKTTQKGKFLADGIASELFMI